MGVTWCGLGLTLWGWLAVRKSGRNEYQEAIQQYATEGWRLVQVLARGIGVYGAAKYYELIFEREIESANGQR